MSRSVAKHILDGVARQPPDPRAQVGRYTLGPLLANGGMGSVHLASYTGADGFRGVVALKRIHGARASEGSLAVALRDEARLAARVRHANVVQLLDVVEERGELAIVFEHVVGITLDELVRGPAIPIPLAVAIAVGILRGLHAAHVATGPDGASLGLVHRDVSPRNVILGTDGTTRVLDFGVAHASTRRVVTATGVVKGKLGYMAPEQLAGAAATPGADVYAVGVILWELVTGEHLFGGATEAEVLAHRLASYAPPSPATMRDDLSPAVATCILHALATDPADRYATAAAMARALEEATPIATNGALADWVTTHQGALVEARAAERASLERASVERPPLESPTDAAEERTEEQTAVERRSFDRETRAEASRRGRLRASVLIVAGILTTAAVALGAAHLAAPPREEATPTTALPPVSPAPLPAPSRSATIPSAPEPSPPSSAPSPTIAVTSPVVPSVPSPTGRARAGVARSGSGRTSAPCIPFEVDANGVKRYHKECLRQE